MIFFALMLSAPTDLDFAPNYVDTGAALFYYEWGCRTGREKSVRAGVMETFRSLPEKINMTVVEEQFEEQLERYGYNLQPEERTCEMDRLLEYRKFHSNARAKMMQP